MIFKVFLGTSVVLFKSHAAECEIRVFFQTNTTFSVSCTAFSTQPENPDKFIYTHTRTCTHTHTHTPPHTRRVREREWRKRPLSIPSKQLSPRVKENNQQPSVLGGWAGEPGARRKGEQQASRETWLLRRGEDLWRGAPARVRLLFPV